MCCTTQSAPFDRRLEETLPFWYGVERVSCTHKPIKDPSTEIVQKYGPLSFENDVLFSLADHPTHGLELLLLGALVDAAHSEKNLATMWDELVAGEGRSDPFIRLSRIYSLFRDAGMGIQLSTKCKSSLNSMYGEESGLGDAMYGALTTCEPIFEMK